MTSSWPFFFLLRGSRDDLLLVLPHEESQHVKLTIGLHFMSLHMISLNFHDFVTIPYFTQFHIFIKRSYCHIFILGETIVIVSSYSIGLPFYPLMIKVQKKNSS
jgi:hypothetical protein